MAIKAKKTKQEPMNAQELWRMNTAQLKNNEDTSGTGSELMAATDTSAERIEESKREFAERVEAGGEV